ncbi:Vacuolar protein sorting-associated protein 20 [Lecanora helva]
MGNTPSSHKISAQDKAILDMKNQRDRLHQYQRRITLITSRETAIARECLAKGDRSKALLALRRKKFQETLLAKTDAQLETLERLTSDVEFAQVQKDVMYGLQQGTSVLKQIHAEMGGIEHVEKLMGETEDAKAYQKEISDMLGGQMSNQDEDEVEDELTTMEVQLHGVPEPVDESGAVKFPVAPGHELPFAEELHQAGQQKARARARAQEREAARAADLAMTA